MMMSGVAQEGLVEVLRAVRSEITDDKIRQAKSDEEPESWKP
jgi:GTP-binding protein